MTTIVAKEYQLLKTPKSKKGYKPNDLPQEPSAASGMTTKPEAYPIHSDSDFEKVDTGSEGKKKREKGTGSQQ